MNLLLDDLNKFENGVIFLILKIYKFFEKKINFKNFNYIEFPYSYQQKRKGVHSKKLL